MRDMKHCFEVVPFPPLPQPPPGLLLPRALSLSLTELRSRVTNQPRQSCSPPLWSPSSSRYLSVAVPLSLAERRSRATNRPQFHGARFRSCSPFPSPSPTCRLLPRSLVVAVPLSSGASILAAGNQVSTSQGKVSMYAMNRTADFETVREIKAKLCYIRSCRNRRIDCSDSLICELILGLHHYPVKNLQANSWTSSEALAQIKSKVCPLEPTPCDATGLGLFATDFGSPSKVSFVN
ncbi:hypothetical protein Syun_016793 [Stephania yunnanensis]|uniref:Uncharacterized protein n=1 Tax=Stephania yunnanensis TaxID=152371 RepID=A0AAP0J824_9MAGN